MLKLSRLLRVGTKGEDVRDLQQHLILLELLDKCQDDGHFGKITEKAVICFQQDNNLDDDGIVGEATAVHLNSELSFLNEYHDYPYMMTAKSLIGLSEIKGYKHNPEIVQMWKDIKRGGIKDDETPWCSAYVGAVMERNGIRSTRFESAKSWLDWGITIDKPVYGCIVVFNRSGGGHVGFCVGQDVNGNLQILGGNQSDQVNVKAFDNDRVVGYRFPEGIKMVDQLPITVASEFSNNEA